MSKKNKMKRKHKIEILKNASLCCWVYSGNKKLFNIRNGNDIMYYINGLMMAMYMFTSTDAEKAFDKI